MNEIFVTVAGTVGTDVTHATGERSNRARFRMATAERYLDRTSGEWVERETVWLDVVCWKALADHVAASVRKGDPVLVRGRLRVSTWQSDQGPRQSLEVIATSVGHDLSRGRATFTRHRREEPRDERATSDLSPASRPRDDGRSAGPSTEVA